MEVQEYGINKTLKKMALLLYKGVSELCGFCSLWIFIIFFAKLIQ